MRNGHGALVCPEDTLAQADGLAIACVEGHGQDGRVWPAVNLDPAVLEEHVINHATHRPNISLDSARQRVCAERPLHLDA